MKTLTITEEEYLQLPLLEKQFYQPITQWLCMGKWESLNMESANSFKDQFPNQEYRTIYAQITHVS